eukprot:420977-Amphidinium_carterae.1
MSITVLDVKLFVKNKKWLIFEMKYSNKPLPKDNEIIFCTILSVKGNSSRLICLKGHACFNMQRCEGESRKKDKLKVL